jgi:hypothetical protein
MSITRERILAINLSNFALLISQIFILPNLHQENMKFKIHASNYENRIKTYLQDIREIGEYSICWMIFVWRQMEYKIFYTNRLKIW